MVRSVNPILKEKKRLKGDWLVTPTGKWNVYNTVHDIY